MSRRLDTRRNAERLDFRETFVHRWGCNARLEDGRFCPNDVPGRGPWISAGPFSERRLCKEHVGLYLTHDLIVNAILDIPPK